MRCLVLALLLVGCEVEPDEPEQSCGWPAWSACYVTVDTCEHPDVDPNWHTPPEDSPVCFVAHGCMEGLCPCDSFVRCDDQVRP